MLYHAHPQRRQNVKDYGSLSQQQIISLLFYITLLSQHLEQIITNINPSMIGLRCQSNLTKQPISEQELYINCPHKKQVSPLAVLFAYVYLNPK